jgi:two-component system cell cycle sensor histidine kinase/response regulator CckA
MTERGKATAPADPIIDRTARLTGVGRLIVLACGLVGAAIAFALMKPENAEPLVLGLLSLLAVIGVFTLFAGAIGLIRFGGRSLGNDLTRLYVESMSDGLLLTDRDGHIIYANRAYGNLTGATTEREIRPVERVFASDTAGGDAIYRLAQGVRDGHPVEEEIRLTSPPAGTAGDTGARWYRIRARPMGLRKGDRSLTAWTVADISRERARQEAVFLELQHAIDYLDHAPVGFFSAEPDGRIVHLNATLADWLGVDLTGFEAGGLRLDDIVRGDALALLAYGAVGRSDQTETIDLDLVKRNGQSLPVRLLHRVPLAADGAPGATRTVVLNRSPGVEASEAVRAAEVRFTRFFNNTPIAIAAVDRQGRIGRTNAPFLRLFATAKGDLATSKRRLVDLIGEAERGLVAEALAEATRGKSGEPIDATIAGGDGRSVRIFLSPVEGAGEDEAVIVNALDTTEQRTLENQLRQQQKMESVGQLAGGVAHDFNNVLTAIIGFSDLLLANHRPSDPSFQDIMNIKQNANRAAGLVRQLLAFSRRQTLRPQVLALGDTLTELSNLLRRLLGENVKLQLVHGRDLWPVKADVNQFEQVVINLAVNGRDAMPGGGTMTIRTRNVTAAETAGFGYKPLPAADYVLIEVDDTGTGMTPEVQAKIFEPFFSTKEVGKGTGLGLSTVYGIVKQTGGHVFFDSTVGRGTSFRIFLPRHIVAEGERPAGPAAEPAVEIADLTGSATILLVEDEEAVRAFAARALASRGYKVFEAASGVEALEVMEEAGGKVDLVVSDVVMPELDGPSLLRELRKTRPELKIIFVSGYAEDAFKKNLPEGEKFAFLPKPFSLKQLAVAVKETLGR